MGEEKQAYPYQEVLKVVFPLIGEGRDLASCMCVSRVWREAACEDYLWQRLCECRWPSICGRNKGRSFRHLFRVLTGTPRLPRDRRALPAPKLSFDALEFYADVWLGEVLVHSAAIPGPGVKSGIAHPPPGISESMREHLSGPPFKAMAIPVSPRFEISFTENIRVSLLVRRTDKDLLARIIDKSGFDYVDGPGYKAHAYDFLQFSPNYPFVPEIRAWLALLLVDAKGDKLEVFGMELDFCDVASSDNEVLWLLDILDWK